MSVLHSHLGLLSTPPTPNVAFSSSSSHLKLRVRVRTPTPRTLARCSTRESPMPPRPDVDYPAAVDCVGTGADVECVAVDAADEGDQLLPPPKNPPLSFEIARGGEEGDPVAGFVGKALDWALLVSPFFFWGTAMVAMKGVIPKTGPFFVSAFRLIPAGAVLIGFAAARGTKLPAGSLAWLSIFLFGVVDAACFQVRGLVIAGL